MFASAEQAEKNHKKFLKHSLHLLDSFLNEQINIGIYQNWIEIIVVIVFVFVVIFLIALRDILLSVLINIISMHTSMSASENRTSH